MGFWKMVLYHSWSSKSKYSKHIYHKYHYNFFTSLFLACLLKLKGIWILVRINLAWFLLVHVDRYCPFDIMHLKSLIIKAMTFGGYVCIHFFELEAVSVHLYLEPQTKQHHIFQLTSRRDLACEFKALSKGSKNGSKPWKNTSTHMGHSNCLLGPSWWIKCGGKTLGLLISLKRLSRNVYI